MKITEEQKKCSARAIDFYYLHRVWSTMADEDNVKASEEDYCLREIIRDLGISDYISPEVLARF